MFPWNKRNYGHSTSTKIKHGISIGSTRAAVAENEAAGAAKSRAAGTCALLQYIILIILLSYQFLHCPPDYAHSPLSLSLSSTPCTTTCKHTLVKFLREESCISTRRRRKSSALGSSSSQHSVAFRSVCSLFDRVTSPVGGLEQAAQFRTSKRNLSVNSWILGKDTVATCTHRNL